MADRQMSLAEALLDRRMGRAVCAGAPTYGFLGCIVWIARWPDLWLRSANPAVKSAAADVRAARARHASDRSVGRLPGAGDVPTQGVLLCNNSVKSARHSLNALTISLRRATSSGSSRSAARMILIRFASPIMFFSCSGSVKPGRRQVLRGFQRLHKYEQAEAGSFDHGFRGHCNFLRHAGKPFHACCVSKLWITLASKKCKPADRKSADTKSQAGPINSGGTEDAPPTTRWQSAFQGGAKEPPC
jgi:hypothetical protein